MPLKSRAVQQRTARMSESADDAQSTEGAPPNPAADTHVEVAPRRTSHAAAPSEPPPADDPPFEGAENEAQSDPPSDEKPAEEPVRKRRSDAGKPRPERRAPVVATEGEAATPAGMRARLRELEGLHKETLRQHKLEMNELAAKHKAALQELAREHAALSTALSKALFKSGGEEQ